MFGSTKFLDQKLIQMLGCDTANLAVHKAVFPGFRMVDFYFAVKAYADGLGSVQHLNAQSHIDLAPLLQERNAHMHRQQIVSATTSTWPTAPDTEDAIPTDGFFIIHAPQETVAIRIRFLEYGQNCVIEIASTRSDGPAEHMTKIEDRATAHSIYRGQMLHFSYQAARKDQYGDVESPEKLQVTFAQASSIADDEIILSDSLRALLKRNIVDLFRRRDILAAHNIPTRRGVLLYGPPGTGKTFACRHICHQLPDTTKIFVTGASLGNVGAIFTLARLLQPTIVFIEDADLMFSSREINLYSSSLGELMDQLDGLRAREDVSVVMTTNAIDRIESALKDRPGRISQCIFMGAPSADLRQRLIGHLLADHTLADEDLDVLVEETKGASQAFLKEWIFRGLQIGCERLERAGETMVPERADFIEALAEMKASDAQSGRIIGFHAS